MASEKGYDPWQALANAIVAAAVEEYRECRYKIFTIQDLLKTTDWTDQESVRQRAERALERQIERKDDLLDFFYSDWYDTLTTFDGDKLVELLEAEEIE